MSLALILAALDDPAAGAGEARQLRLYRLLKAAILEGRLAPGARLPGTRQLAADWGMARNCVLFAYQLLLAELYAAIGRKLFGLAALALAASGCGPAVGDECQTGQSACLDDHTELTAVATLAEARVLATKGPKIFFIDSEVMVYGP